ncbi:MAG TPA: hypothetical protein VME66_06040, partial [Candidatus Acidoferrales bacterium]|nr:hypothetical protein [Candidatus Acidoferrales bacterium]
MRITGIVRPFFVAAVLAALSFAGAPAVADDMSGMGNMSGMPGMSTAAGIEMTHIAGPYRVVLDLLPAERFYTRAQAARHAGAGMIVIGGAAPVQPGSRLEPNHHLVVHLYDRASGKAVRGAHVTITYAPAGSMMSMTLPVV